MYDDTERRSIHQDVQQLIWSTTGVLTFIAIRRLSLRIRQVKPTKLKYLNVVAIQNTSFTPDKQTEHFDQSVLCKICILIYKAPLHRHIQELQACKNCAVFQPPCTIT